MAIKFLSGQTITGNITLSGDITAATFNSFAINSTGTNNVANEIVRTQGNGYVNFGWINSVSGNHTGSITRITASNDAYLRYVTPAQFRTGVTDGYYASAGTVDGVTSVATGNGLSGGTITSTGTLTMSGSYTGDFTVTGNLDVTSTASDAVFLRSSQATTTNVYITNTNATANNTANLYFAPANNVAGSYIKSTAIEDFSTSANRTSDLRFAVRKDGTFNEALIIDSSGNVGIGGGTIEGKLSIDYTAAELPTSGTTSNSAIQVTSSLGNQLNLGLNTVSGGYGAYIQASDNNLAVPYPLNLQPNGGNVGIGTISPDAKLHIYGSTSLSEMYLGEDAAADKAGILKYTQGNGSGTGVITLSHWGNNSLTEGLAVKYGGNVGIGTNSPDDLLTLAGNTSSYTTVPVVRFDSTSTDSSNIRNWAIGPADTEYGNFHIFKSAARGGDPVNTAGIVATINYLGNVGIGTTNPSEMLHMNNTSGTGCFIRFQNTGGSGVYIGGRSEVMEMYTNGSEKMRITSSGNVGIGTASPDILGYGNTSRALALQGIIGTASAQRPVVVNLAGQRDDGTDGYVSDINFLNMASNGTTVNSRAIMRMSREGADNSNRLEFWTALAGSTTERMRITSGGTVLIGTQTVTSVSKLQLISSNLFYGFVDRAQVSGTGTPAGFFNSAGSLVGSIGTSNTSTSYNETSDYRLKEDLQDFAGLDMISKIPVYDFKWKIDESRSYGVMAHELEEVLPQAVTGEKDAVNEDESISPQGVDYSKIVPLLVKSIQELKAEIDDLKNKCNCK